MSLSLIASLSLLGWLAFMFLQDQRGGVRELSRFKNVEQVVHTGSGPSLQVRLKQLLERLRSGTLFSQLADKQEEENMKKLLSAGLESEIEQARFKLFKTICTISGPIVGSLAYLYVIPYYATIITLVTTATGILVPLMILRNKAMRRFEEIQRELPLVLDLTNLGTSAGWDVGTALERVIESLQEEFSDHPLIKELKKARWLVASGYTWEEALNRVGDKLGHDSVKRTALALGQAIRQGGDRSSQLEGIAEDAHRTFNSELDKRLAALPVKALLITMMLMVAYFIILLAPATIHVKQIMK